MKLKLHHFYLILATAAVVVSMFFPLIHFVYADGAETMTNFSLIHLDGTAVHSPWALGALLIAVACVNVFTLFISLFRNFVLQKRCCIFSMLLTAGYYILFLLFTLIMKSGSTSVQPAWTMVLPLVSIILAYMAFMAICHEEARIIAKANGFRLRD